ncbi:hypothetical protein ACLBWT_04115 [Paenibacillus sp. D51F]
MKLGGFIAGSLIGAAAALYVARKRPGAAAAASGIAGKLWSKAAGRAMSGMIRNKSGATPRRSPVRSSSGNGSSRVADSGSWERIAALVNSDPEVKKESEKIIAEASSSPATH